MQCPFHHVVLERMTGDSGHVFKACPVSECYYARTIKNPKGSRNENRKTNRKRSEVLSEIPSRVQVSATRRQARREIRDAEKHLGMRDVRDMERLR